MSIEMSEGSMGAFSWKIGQTPNLVILYLLQFFTCSIGYIVHLYNLYQELNRAFPEYDHSKAIFKSVLSIWSWCTLDAEIDALAAKANVEIPKAKVPALCNLLCGLTASFVLADQMNRINALCQAVAEQQK